MLRFIKDWTLPCAIAVGTTAYLVFYCVPQLDAAGDTLSPIFDRLLPLTVFLTLLVTFCKVDFHLMRPHRWHVGVLAAQLLLVAATVAIILYIEAHPSPLNSPLSPLTSKLHTLNSTLFWEAILTCIIGPAASASPVVVGKLGGNISTMTTYVLISAFFSALLIPTVFPILPPHPSTLLPTPSTLTPQPSTFLSAFLMILQKVSAVLLLPLVLGWLIQRHVKPLQRWVAAQPNLSFYCWAVSLSITTGITVKNIVHSEATLVMLTAIAVGTLLLCAVQFVIGRAIGRKMGEEINAGQALFQKNTALSIWVAYMYLSPVASIGAGCYVLWQNIINSVELWQYKKGR